jgi:redox-sensing transcriptional repressor
VAERIPAGVVARLSGYLRVLTQAKKTGRARITSNQLAAYTGVNASQVRRDLSRFGKFGTRGLGYSVEAVLGEIRELLLAHGAHPIALVGAGRLGQAIANSPIFAEHGISITAIFDLDPAKVGQQLGPVTVSDATQLNDTVRVRGIVVGVLAVPAASAQRAANDLVEAGVNVIFNYSDALLDLPDEIRLVTSNPAAELIAALYLQSGRA